MSTLWQRVEMPEVTIGLTPLMEYDDLWPVCLHQSCPVLTRLNSQLTLSHTSPEGKVKTGPGSASVTMLASSPAVSGCQDGGSEGNVWWLSDWQETLLSSGLSGCLQRRWREHWRTERPFHWHCVPLLLVSSRYTHPHTHTKKTLHWSNL